MKPFLFLSPLLTPFCMLAKSPFNIAAQRSSLVFIENKGQVTDQYGSQRKDIQFKLEAQGMNIFIGSGQIHYQWSKPITNKRSIKSGQPDPAPSQLTDQQQTEICRLDVALIGANTKAKLITEEPQEYYENY